MDDVNVDIETRAISSSPEVASLAEELRESRLDIEEYQNKQDEKILQLDE